MILYLDSDEAVVSTKTNLIIPLKPVMSSFQLSSPTPLTISSMNSFSEENIEKFDDNNLTAEYQILE